MKLQWIRLAIITAGLLVLGQVHLLIAHKEGIRAHGQLIFLALAPVDPRSLMQGDYMTLNFDLARTLSAELSDTQRQRGGTFRAPLQIDQRGIAVLAKTASAQPALRYKVRDQQIWLGTNGYFFEEGSAQKYEAARFGAFRMDPASGEAVLIALADEQLNLL
jgi:uncharacterized membrane-anchored protein